MRIQPIDLDNVLEENESILNSLNDSSIFITGSSGFMGSWIIETLRQAYMSLHLRARIVLLVREMPRLACYDVFQYIVRDIAEIAPEDKLGNYDFVLHLANSHHVDPAEAYRINTQGMNNMLACFLGNCKTFVYTSSGAVYKHGMFTDEEAFLGAPPFPNNSKDAYRASKMISEFMVKHSATSDSNFVILRPFTFFGPGLNGGFAILEFMEAAVQGKTIVVHSPNTLRTYMYPTDLLKWIFEIMFRCNRNDTFNIGSPYTFTLIEIANIIAGMFGVDVETIPSEQHNPNYVPKVQKAMRAFGLSNTISLEEGLLRWKNYQALYGTF
jgi:nucleoside-diphosphate-sugar epimerase